MTFETNIIRDALNHGARTEEQFMALIEAQGEEALEMLLIALQDIELRIRIRALLYISKLGDIRAVEPIIRFVHQDTRYRRFSPNLRERTLTLLIPVLRSMQKDCETAERRADLCAAILALGKLATDDAIGTIRILHDDSDAEVASVARKVFVRLGFSTD